MQSNKGSLAGADAHLRIPVGGVSGLTVETIVYPEHSLIHGAILDMRLQRLNRLSFKFTLAC